MRKTLKYAAVAIAVLVLIVAALALAAGPLADSSYVLPGAIRVAAADLTAIRDNVTTFQKWGTRIFTWRYLTRYYDAAWYFTQSSYGDKKEAFLSCLDNALERYRAVDLFLLAHSNEYVAWAATLPEAHRRRIRLVYNTGCHNLPQGQQWLDLGAKAYVGHPGVSTSPVFYYYFLRRWTYGLAIREAVDESNVLARRKFEQAEAATFGRLNAESFVRESWASSCGDDRLRIEDGRK
jgi:phage tail protein X